MKSPILATVDQDCCRTFSATPLEWLAGCGNKPAECRSHALDPIRNSRKRAIVLQAGWFGDAFPRLVCRRADHLRRSHCVADRRRICRSGFGLVLEKPDRTIARDHGRNGPARSAVGSANHVVFGWSLAAGVGAGQLLLFWDFRTVPARP